MIGAIVGDVLGSVYEGAMIKTKGFRLYDEQDRLTDDSILTLAVARAILGAGEIPTEADFALGLREFGRRYPRAGYGGRFLRWLHDPSMGPYRSWGNGSAMRSSAVGWAYETVDDVLVVAERTALPTHNHPDGVKGAQAVALAVFLARRGVSRQELRRELTRRFGYDLERTVDEIRPEYVFEVGCERSVPESIIAFLDSVDFEDAIRNAISLGGDADTQACIAGTVAEAFYGGVPESILAWVLPRLDGPQLRIAREFAGRYMRATGVADSIDRLVGDRLPGGRNASKEHEQPHRRNPEYRVVLSGDTWGRATDYATQLRASRRSIAGRRVAQELEALTGIPGDEDGLATCETDRRPVTPDQVIQALLNSKRPRIFAESEVRGDGSDWTQEELRLLGDVTIAVPVTVYDDGRHNAPLVHDRPYPATLLYVPGALLRSGRGAAVAADRSEVVRDGEIDQERYTSLHERRLLPGLRYASATAEATGRQVLVTIPGLGCGQFAGSFRGTLGGHLRDAIVSILRRHVGSLTGIRAVWFDPYSELDNEDVQIDDLTLYVRPLLRNKPGLPQLSRPEAFARAVGDSALADCELTSVVAWDHVSWPGNDFFAGARSTDDGVKAAATDSMYALTGFRGHYDASTYTYDPPADVRTWEDLVVRNDLHLRATGNVVVVGAGSAAT